MTRASSVLKPILMATLHCTIPKLLRSKLNAVQTK